MSDRSRSVKNHFLLEDRRDELNDFSTGAENASTIYSAGNVLGSAFASFQKWHNTWPHNNSTTPSRFLTKPRILGVCQQDEDKMVAEMYLGTLSTPFYLQRS